MFLKSRFQHGGQDDYDSPDNPGVGIGDGRTAPDRFAAFERGEARYFANPALVKAFYEKRGLDWPYDGSGVHRAGR